MGGLLLEDLRKRRVVRVAAGYVLVSVAVLLTLGVIQAWTGLPDWTMRMVAGISFVALPFLLVFVWALEDSGPESPRTRRRTPAGVPQGPHPTNR